MSHVLANETYFYAGHVNGLCKFVHKLNATAENRLAYNKFSCRDTEDEKPFTHEVVIPVALLENCLITKQFFENDCAFPWLIMMTEAYGAASGGVSHDKARYYNVIYGDLAAYEYMRSVSTRCLLSFVPSPNCGDNHTIPDLWVPCYEAVNYGLLPDRGLGENWQLAY